MDQQPNHELRTLLLGLAIVAPCLIGWLLDQLFGTAVMFTFIGAAFGICELVERIANRTSAASTELVSPSKLEAHDLLQDELDNERERRNG